MRRVGRALLKALTGGAVLGLGCLAVVYSAEIVAFFGDNALWVLGGLAVWTVASVVVGLFIGAMLRQTAEVLPPQVGVGVPVKPATGAGPEAPTVDIPVPTSPHDSEQGVPLTGPARRRLTAQ